MHALFGARLEHPYTAGHFQSPKICSIYGEVRFVCNSASRESNVKRQTVASTRSTASVTTAMLTIRAGLAGPGSEFRPALAAIEYR